jgi:uncharacterized damage-inducible protein DinB
MKALFPLVPFVLATACTLHAQVSNPLISESKENFSHIAENLQKAAEAMPEENYSFKPTPDIRSFGQLIAHIADAQSRICSVALGEQKSVNAQSKTAKADLVAAIKESTSICNAAFDSVTDANATQMVSFGPRKLSKLGALIYNTTHSNEEYGYLSVYLRLKGVVPPSTANRGK